jgi:hypothetical protein
MSTHAEHASDFDGRGEEPIDSVGRAKTQQATASEGHISRGHYNKERASFIDAGVHKLRQLQDVNARERRLGAYGER